MANDKNIVLTDNEQLIYDLIFSNDTIFFIDLQKYCKCYEDRTHFRDYIRVIMKRTKTIINDDRIIHTNETVFWKLELDRKKFLP
jgi:hypothetical protein